MQHTIPSQPSPALLLLDFDQTLVKGHYHNLLTASGCRPAFDPAQPTLGRASALDTASDDVRQHVQAYLQQPQTGLKNPDQTRESIQSALRAGIHVGIISFNQYPEIFILVLQALGLSPQEIAQIDVMSHLPLPDQQVLTGKNPHIQTLMERAGVTEFENVCLVDDSAWLGRHAEHVGCSWIQAPMDEAMMDGYLAPVLTWIQQHAQPGHEPSREPVATQVPHGPAMPIPTVSHTTTFTTPSMTSLLPPNPPLAEPIPTQMVPNLALGKASSSSKRARDSSPEALIQETKRHDSSGRS